MVAPTGLGKGLDAAGEFGSTLLSGDIQATFSAPAAAQNIPILVTNDMQIIGWTILMLVSGSIQFDVWRTSISGAGLTPPALPVAANSIAGTYKPTLTSGSVAHGGSPPGYQPNAQSMFELGWGGNGVAANAGTFLNAGDYLVINVVSFTAGSSALLFIHTLQGS
jgi:hypothetical protein